MILHINRLVEIMIQIPVWNGPHRNYVPDQQIVVMEAAPQIKDQTGIVQMEIAPTIVYMTRVANNNRLIIFLVTIMMFGGLTL